MGIKFYCPSCDKRLNVKSFLAGKAGYCPQCQAKLQIPTESEPKRPKSADPGLSTVLRQPEPQFADHNGGSGVIVAVAVNGNATGNGRGKTPAANLNSSTPTLPATPQVQPDFGFATSPQMGNADLAAIAAASKPKSTTAIAPSPQPLSPVPTQAVAPVVPAVPSLPANPAAAVSDPIAEAPQAVWYVRPTAGGQYGPAAGELLRKWMGEGRVSADSLVWREGWPEWRKAAAIFPALAPSPATVASAAPQLNLAQAAKSPGSLRRGGKSPRRQKSPAVVIGAIVALVILSMVLFGGLLHMLDVI